MLWCDEAYPFVKSWEVVVNGSILLAHVEIIVGHGRNQFVRSAQVNILQTTQTNHIPHSSIPGMNGPIRSEYKDVATNQKTVL